ncbi:MAG: two-component system response regulator, partial [Symploca sp. SIO2B6]|nr:two-component system response regulator [Symploca sp. SIO2B6]
MTPSKYILVIDDEPDIREIVQVSLECTRPWHVLDAESAAAGLAIAQNHHLDAILL